MNSDRMYLGHIDLEQSQRTNGRGETCRKHCTPGRFRAVVPPLSEEANAGFLIKVAEPDQGQIRRRESKVFDTLVMTCDTLDRGSS